MDKRFAMHGDMQVRIEGQILFLEGIGPWNRESLNVSDDEASEVVQTLYYKPWGVVVSLGGEAIYVPDAANDLIEIVRREKGQGRVATAILVDHSDTPQFAKSHMSDIYSRANETFEFFANQEDAISWVKQQIALATQAESD